MIIPETTRVTADKLKATLNSATVVAAFLRPVGGPPTPPGIQHTYRLESRANAPGYPPSVSSRRLEPPERRCRGFHSPNETAQGTSRESRSHNPRVPPIRLSAVSHVCAVQAKSTFSRNGRRRNPAANLQLSPSDKNLAESSFLPDSVPAARHPTTPSREITVSPSVTESGLVVPGERLQPVPDPSLRRRRPDNAPSNRCESPLSNGLVPPVPPRRK